ncbi:glycogen debranching protein GlgX [Desulfogranum mediterraneum]|uniref:glycogen debranching protein GlgX n=1 Tax=Desulfogranum mediterraneum TaxID=160661 RepID=UPI00040D97D2|nr:glycogen debranching protein GlgX [Desulfogranum mediterraneum]
MKHYHTYPAGAPLPLGASLTPRGVNFALFSRNATAVSLVLEIPHSSLEQQVELPLDPEIHKTGDIWHILLPALKLPIYYGYRVKGEFDPEGSGHAFDDSLILLDPYAKELRPSNWGEQNRDLGKKPCCSIHQPEYNWEGDRPLNIPLKDSIIYETHVRGFSQDPSAGVANPGTFQGLCEKIDYLRELGITAVELMPVTEFNENESIFVNPESGEALKNYWGYSPLSFFAPKSGYCAPWSNPLNEFRDMVKALHRAGIEVILDIVYNHTAEGGIDGPTTSFRGIDNTIYYLLDPWTRTYLNFSGCGNTCNCNHPIVRNLIIDALHWWVIEMHVDGFRFDLASILGRDSTGEVLANPPMVEMIAEDPVLAKTKIIAEAWDAAGLYQVGSFSTHHRWAEWNGRFRDDLRAFICGNQGTVASLATRIAGSSDLYQAHNRRPCNSINFITSHDGFTLADLVSYDKKHNQMNGEDNRDGDNHNLSWNSGVEGPTADQAIQRLRSRRCRTLLVLLFVSQGVPMLVAGDEFGRSQQGNNNAWCQDNELSWLDWSLLERNNRLFAFVRQLIRLRREHAVFRRDTFFVTRENEDEPPHIPEISWHGLQPGVQDWSSDCHTLAFMLNGRGEQDDDFYLLFNGSRGESRTFTVPAPPRRRRPRRWKKIIDTGLSGPDDFQQPEDAEVIRNGARLKVAAMGCVVLQSRSGEHKQDLAGAEPSPSAATARGQIRVP